MRVNPSTSMQDMAFTIVLNSAATLHKFLWILNGCSVSKVLLKASFVDNSMGVRVAKSYQPSSVNMHKYNEWIY